MKNDNNHIDYAGLIGKYLAKEAGAEEITTLEKWVAESNENKDTFNKYKQSWILSGINKKNKKIDVESEWVTLSSKLFRNRIEPAPSPKVKELQPGIPLIFKIAAAVVVLFTVSFFLYNSFLKPGTVEMMATTTIETETLSDGTTITLNRNSTFKYPKKFTKDVRKVELTGDAYFEVEHNKNQPFIIESQNIEIEVLGTSFYVDSHEDNSTVEVVVNSGGVVLRSDKENQIILKAGDKGIFNKKTGKLFMEKNTDVNYNSWNTKLLVFDDTKLAEVVDKLNEVYDANIEITSPEIDNYRITVTFDNMTIEAVINILRETLNIVIEKHDNGYFISGD